MARSRRVRVRRQKAWARVLSGLMSALIAFEPVAIHAQSLPVIPVSPGTTLDAAQNGVPIVNIATPNGKGLSHNRFEQFNVGNQGLILNNGTSAGVSVLGGAIAANANLGGASARLILNEVTGAARTSLEGATEIFGGRAEYILANPNGITCDGCGFINTPQATLTTGTPLLNADGSLAGLNVTGGDIAIGARGLDAREADAFDLVARSVTIAGPVNGNDIGVVAGRNAYDTTTRQAAALADDGSEKPLFAIDSSALGGMYAGRIALIGTEAGVGVRMDGELATSTAGLTLSADGRIEVRKASAAGDLAVTTGDALVVGDSLTAAGSASIAADRLDLATGTQIGAVGDVTLAARTASIGGTLAAGMEGGSGALSATATEALSVTGSASARGDLTLAADALEVSGQATGGAHARLEGREVLVSGTASGDRVTVAATGDATVSGAVEAATAAELSAGRDATIAATGAVSAQTVSLAALNDVTVAGRAVATGDLALSAGGTARVESGGRVQAGGALTVTANAVDNAGTLQAAGDITATVADAFANADLVFAGASLAIEAKTATNAGGTLLAIDNIYVTAIGEILNAAGVIETADGDIRLVGATVRNVGAQTAEGLANELVLEEYYPMIGGVARPSCPLDSTSCKGEYWKRVAAVPDPRPGYTGTSYYGTSSSGSATSRIYEPRATGIGGTTALITSGRDLVLTGDAIKNEQGTVSAVRDIAMTGDTLTNQGLMGTGTWQISVSNGTMTRCYGDSICAGFGNGGGTAILYSWGVELAPAIIQAGGSITGTFTDRIDNTSIRAGYTQTTDTYKALIGSIKETSLDWGDHGTLPQSQAALDAYLGATIPGFKSLFTTANANSSYVYESRVAYTSLGTFYGSDYFFTRAGLSSVDYEALPKRLGDAYFDTQYIRDQIIAETGSRWLDPQVANDAEQLKALIDGGVAVAGDLALSVGVALTAEQIAALDRDIVWYETAVVDGREVLVPHLYLADATRAALTPTGAVIAAAGGVDLNALTVVNAEGRIEAGTALTVAAAEDIYNLSGKLVSGGDMALTAGGDVVIATQTTAYDDGARNSRDVRLGEAGLNAGGNLAVTAGGDITATGAKVAAGGDASFAAEGDVTFQALAQSRHEEEGNSKEGYRLDALDHHLTTVEVGGSTTVEAGENLSLIGAKLASGGETKLEAEGDVTIAAVTDTYSLESWKKKSGFMRSSSSYGKTDQITVQSSMVLGGGDVSIAAETGNTVLTGSSVIADGDINLSGQDVRLESAQEFLETTSIKKKSGAFASVFAGEKGFGISAGVRSSKDRVDHAEVTNVVSGVMAGENVTITARGDVKGDAPVITAGKDVAIQAGNDVSIDAVADSVKHSESHKVSQTGVTVAARQSATTQVRTIVATPGNMTKGEGGVGAEALTAASAAMKGLTAFDSLNGSVASVEIGIGSSSSKSSVDIEQSNARVGNLGAGQDVTIKAGQDVTLEGTQVAAGGDITLEAGRDLNIGAAASSSKADQSSSSSSAGVKLSGSVGFFGGGSIGVSADVALAQSNRDQNGTTYTNATLKADKDISLKSGQDTSVRGGEVVAGDTLTVDAGRNLTVESLQNTNSIDGSSSNVSASIGWKWGSNGGLNGSVSAGVGSEKGSRRFTDDQTQLIAKNDVSIHTGEHTQITGAVIASTDGNVSIDTGTLGYADLQDEDKYRASTVQVSASSSSETSGPSSGAPGNDSSPVAAGGTIEGSYSSSKTEGVTRATVASPNGSTTITIRSNPSQGLEGLNSDLAKAQEITKTKKVNVEVYVNSDTIKEIVGGFPTAKKIRDAVIEQIRKIYPAEADSLKAKDRIIDKLIKQQSIKSGVPEEKLRDILDSDPGLIKKIENGDAFAKLYGATEDKDVIEAAAKAIIQGGYILTDGQGTPLLDERGYARIGGILVEALPDIPGSAVVRLPGESTGSFVKQAGEYAESAVLSLSRLLDQYGAAGEAIYTATSLAVLGPAKTALSLVAGRVVSEITGEMTAEAMDYAAQKLKGLDASLTDGEAFALVTAAGLGIALAASYKDVKNLLSMAKAKLGGKGAATEPHPHETPTSGANNSTLDDLVSNGTHRSADEINASFPGSYSPPYTPGTQVTEFVSDGKQTFVRVVSSDKPEGQWVMKQSDIEGLTPQQIAEKFALPETPTGVTSITPPAGTRIRTGEVNENFGHAGGGTQFQLLDKVEGWADVIPLT